jgi:hypothetical protein
MKTVIISDRSRGLVQTCLTQRDIPAVQHKDIYNDCDHFEYYPHLLNV